MTTTVINMTRTHRFDVRIDRTTKWGNPFYVGRHGSRAQVIERYEAYVKSSPELMAALSELKGKTLGCWCKPLPCHGDVLVRLAEAHEGVDRPTGFCDCCGLGGFNHAEGCVRCDGNLV